MTNVYLRAAKNHPTLKAQAKEQLEKRKGQGKPDQPGKPLVLKAPQLPAGIKGGFHAVQGV